MLTQPQDKRCLSLQVITDLLTVCRALPLKKHGIHVRNTSLLSTTKRAAQLEQPFLLWICGRVKLTLHQESLDILIQIPVEHVLHIGAFDAGPEVFNEFIGM